MMASSSAPQQQPLSSLSNTNELRSLNRNVVTAYLQPLLSKHDTKTIMTYEDLTASLEAAMRVWKSDATVEDTKQKEAVRDSLLALHNGQLKAYREAAITALRSWAASTKLPEWNPTLHDTVLAYQKSCRSVLMATVPRWRDDTSYSSSSSINPYSTATPLVPLMTLAFGRISERAAETYAAHHVKKTSSSNNDKVLRGFTSHVPKPPLSFIQENASTVKPGEVTQANAPATEKVKSIVVDEKEEEGEIEEEEDGEMNELEEGEEGEEEDDVAPSTTPSSEANQPVARKITTVNLKKGHVNRKATPIKAKIGTTHTKAMQHNRKANSSSPMLAGTNPSVAAATSSAVAATASASNNTTNQVANTTSSRGRRGRGRGGRGGNNINNTAK